jgi:hypothetical protein
VNPSYSPAYRCLASAFAHLGRDADAREAAARVLEFDDEKNRSGPDVPNPKFERFRNFGFEGHSRI